MSNLRQKLGLGIKRRRGPLDRGVDPKQRALKITTDTGFALILKIQDVL